MKPDTVRSILDQVADWVFLLAARRAYDAIDEYTATLEKQERLGRKLQDVETVELKLREQPKAIYMRWIAGPHKGRQVLYNEQLLGGDQIRVREAGLLGVVPVTIALDSAVAKRGTNHLVTEVGFRHLLYLIEKDFLKATPRGDLRRANHGLSSFGGRSVFKMESILPRDASLGYYCHRIMHYMDYMRMWEVGCEIYNFDDRLQESYFYKNVRANPGLTDADFDPSNRQYKLK